MGYEGDGEVLVWLAMAVNLAPAQGTVMWMDHSAKTGTGAFPFSSASVDSFAPPFISWFTATPQRGARRGQSVVRQDERKVQLFLTISPLAPERRAGKMLERFA